MSIPVTLSGVIVYFDSSSAAVEAAHGSLDSTFQGVNIRLEEVDQQFVKLDTYGTDRYFELLRGYNYEDFAILLVPDVLYTGFGKRLAGETRETLVIVSAPLITESNANRLFRHELGNVFGFSQHLDCVMSPYYVEDHGFCLECVSGLARRGILLRPTAVRSTPAKLSPGSPPLGTAHT